MWLISQGTKICIACANTGNHQYKSKVIMKDSQFLARSICADFSYWAGTVSSVGGDERFTVFGKVHLGRCFLLSWCRLPCWRPTLCYPWRHTFLLWKSLSGKAPPSPWRTTSSPGAHSTNSRAAMEAGIKTIGAQCIIQIGAIKRKGSPSWNPLRKGACEIWKTKK